MRKTIEDIFLLRLVSYQGFYLSGLKKIRGGRLKYSKRAGWQADKYYLYKNSYYENFLLNSLFDTR